MAGSPTSRLIRESLIQDMIARNEGFLKNAIDYAQAVVISAELIRAFPDWLKE